MKYQENKSLLDFKNKWLANIQIACPKFDALNFIGKCEGITLYREDNFQVQLFIFEPNAVVESHTHPNVDTYQIMLCGSLKFFLDGRNVNVPKLPDARSIMDERYHLRLPNNSIHGGVVGPNGASYLSIQHWLDGIPISSLEKNWSDSFGNIKGNIVKSFNKTE